MLSLVYPREILVLKRLLETLVTSINVENAWIQQIGFYVFLNIHAVFRHVTLFV
jgi:hypothetical protein